MPSTYTLISSNVLSSTAASVTFSAIPSTYTDLVLRWSVNTSSLQDGTIYFNGTLGTTNYSRTFLAGNGATASSGRASNREAIDMDYIGSATANTFASGEMYLPNYAGSVNKPLSTISALEANSTTAYLRANAGLARVTAAVTSLTIAAAGTFSSGSSFYLYGVKNS